MMNGEADTKLKSVTEINFIKPIIGPITGIVNEINRDIGIVNAGKINNWLAMKIGINVIKVNFNWVINITVKLTDALKNAANGANTNGIINGNIIGIKVNKAAIDKVIRIGIATPPPSSNNGKIKGPSERIIPKITFGINPNRVTTWRKYCKAVKTLNNKFGIKDNIGNDSNLKMPEIGDTNNRTGDKINWITLITGATMLENKVTPKLTNNLNGVKTVNKLTIIVINSLIAFRKENGNKP